MGALKLQFNIIKIFKFVNVTFRRKCRKLLHYKFNPLKVLYLYIYVFQKSWVGYVKGVKTMINFRVNVG
jgi:hypothetical protein